jgi:rhodanese-related sulfurtransferase
LLRGHGYRVTALRGGINAWRDAGLPLEPIDQKTPGERVA